MSFAPFFVVVVIALVFIKKINAYFVCVCVCARAHSFTGTVETDLTRARVEVGRG